MLLASSHPSALPYVGLMVLGFVVGGLGSAHRSKPATALGILMVLAATMTFQFRLYEAGN